MHNKLSNHCLVFNPASALTLLIKTTALGSFKKFDTSRLCGASMAPFSPTGKPGPARQVTARFMQRPVYCQLTFSALVRSCHMLTGESR